MAGPLTKAGRYEIVSELGRGSMGVVYRGYDPIIGRTVAIKTMLIEGLPPSEFQEYKQRFQREAQAAGVLTHPNIVTVYDFGEDGGILYLAMEFLEGKSIQQLVEQHNVMPIETLIPMYEQICSALDHAHQHKIVHRDVKPANIMILESGLVKVTDFGIAKVMSMGMTQAGQILGTPNYMSPEQVKGRQVDGRSDIFSLGVILYELVTGEKPFGGNNITTVIYKIINEDPIPPRQLDSTIHPGLSYVISKALAKNPAERYQTCRLLAEDLRNFKNLGNMGAPSATLVIKVPPISSPGAQTQVPTKPVASPPRPLTPPPPPRLVQRSTPPPMEREIHPPPQPHRVEAPPPTPAHREPRPPAPVISVLPQRSSSPVAWVLLIIILLAGVGVGGFYYYNNVYLPQQQKVSGTTNVQPPGTAGGSTTTTEPGKPATNPQDQPGSTATQPEPGAATQPPATGSTTTEPTKPPVVATTATHTPPPPKESASGGKVVLTSSPRGAAISLDGNATRWVTPRALDLPVGDHEISLSKDGYKTETVSISVESGRTIDRKIELAEVAPPTPEPTKPTTTTGSTGGGDQAGLVIVTTPPGLDILIDGKSQGKSPVTVVLAPGEHTFTYTCPGGETTTSPITVKAGSIGTHRIRCAE
jgi:serine/threonine protein kinase